MFENLFSERGFSVDRLKSLVEIANAGSIIKAVRGDNVRQSQYSRQIKELEEFFGIQLTRKKGKVLVLTSAGGELVKIANQYFSTLDDFRTNCKNIPRRFKIGAGDSIHNWIVSPILSKIAKDKKPWLFTLENLQNNAVANRLLDMQIDFGILRTTSILSNILKYKAIQHVEYAMYIPKNLLRKKEFDYKWVFENIPIATLAFDSSFATMLKNCSIDAGIDFKITLETQSFPFAGSMLKEGQFAAILPTMAEKYLDKNIVKIQPRFFKSLERDIAIAWNPRLIQARPTIKHVIDYFLHNRGIC